MNSTEYRVKILGLLENYQEDTATISLLKMALNRAPRVSTEDVIGSMNFAHGDGIGTVTGHISDRTAYIAMHYMGKTDAINVGSFLSKSSLDFIASSVSSQNQSSSNGSIPYFS